MADIKEVFNRDNKFAEFKKDHKWDPWFHYAVKVRVDRLAGGIPQDPKMVTNWIKSKCKKLSEEEQSKLIQATVEEIPGLVEEEEKKGWTSFKEHLTYGPDKDEKGNLLVTGTKGLCIEGRQVHAMLKEAGNIVKPIVPASHFQKAKVKAKTKPNAKKVGENEEGDDLVELDLPSLAKSTGIHNLKSKVAEVIKVLPSGLIHLNRFQEDLITEQRPIHLKDRFGNPVSALKITSRLENVDVTWVGKLLKSSELTMDTVWALLDYAQWNGLGADRSQGMGFFTVESAVMLTSEEEAIELASKL